MPTAGDLAHSPGMRPNWESNPQTSGLQNDTQSIELHQSHLFGYIIDTK